MRRLALIVLLAASTPGCLTALVAATGASAQTIQATLDAETSIVGALAEVAAADACVYASAGDYSAGDQGPTNAAGEADPWICRIDGTEEQRVRAYSVEGARAACFMTNDVVMTGGCDCVPAR